MKKMRKCCIEGCTSHDGQSRSQFSNEPILSLHAFPKDEERRNLWLANIKRKNGLQYVKKYHYICSLHFDELSIDRSGYRIRLKENAIPSYSPPVVTLINEVESSNTSQSNPQQLHSSNTLDLPSLNNINSSSLSISSSKDSKPVIITRIRTSSDLHFPVKVSGSSKVKKFIIYQKPQRVKIENNLSMKTEYDNNCLKFPVLPKEKTTSNSDVKKLPDIHTPTKHTTNDSETVKLLIRRIKEYQNCLRIKNRIIKSLQQKLDSESATVNALKAKIKSYEEKS